MSGRKGRNTDTGRKIHPFYQTFKEHSFWMHVEKVGRGFKYAGRPEHIARSFSSGTGFLQEIVNKRLQTLT